MKSDLGISAQQAVLGSHQWNDGMLKARILPRRLATTNVPRALFPVKTKTLTADLEIEGQKNSALKTKWEIITS